MLRHLAMLAFAVLTATAAGAQADPDIAPIRGIFVHVQPDIADDRFVTPLMERLRRDLAPPVTLNRSRLDLAAVPVRLWRYDAEALVRLVAGHVDPVAGEGFIHVLLVPRDMRSGVARFWFAYSHGGRAEPRRVIVVSLARLADANPQVTAARVARLVEKNAARVAGLAGSDLCVMDFPNSLAVLDAMPETWCEPDRARLVAAGLARP